MCTYGCKRRTSKGETVAVSMAPNIVSVTLRLVADNWYRQHFGPAICSRRSATRYSRVRRAPEFVGFLPIPENGNSHGRRFLALKVGRGLVAAKRRQRRQLKRLLGRACYNRQADLMIIISFMKMPFSVVFVKCARTVALAGVRTRTRNA